MKFVIPIVPTAQARPRFSRFGTHRSKPQQANERTIEALIAPHRPADPITGPVVLAVDVYLPIPKSKPKRWQAKAMAGEVHPAKRPDLDNYIKQIADCLGRLRFWNDDAQVVRIVAAKRYSDRPRWEVGIQELPC